MRILSNNHYEELNLLVLHCLHMVHSFENTLLMQLTYHGRPSKRFGDSSAYFTYAYVRKIN